MTIQKFPNSSIRVAFVYDRVNKWGGAERILLALKDIFPDAPLFTSVYDENKAVWVKSFKIKTSFLQKIHFFRSRHEFLAGLMPIVFESFDFLDYDLVISITSESAKGVITNPKTAHFCICLTPTRYLWSGYKDYFKNSLFKFISRPLVSYLRKWDKIASVRPDKYIAISQTVKNRIEKYYQQDSTIIYPPISRSLEENIDSVKIDFKNSDYFLVVSRLSRHAAYKRVDLAIKAAIRAKKKLIVIGEGKDAEYFKSMANSQVVFLGKVDDATLASYYKNAQALVFPGKEDFGLVMAEAQRAGTPVIAYRAGGAREIIKSGITGEFFDKQSVEVLCDLLKSFKRSRYNTNTCILNGKRFTQDRFETELMNILKEYVTL